jgi:hypothetical protein
LVSWHGEAVHGGEAVCIGRRGEVLGRGL